MLLMMQISILSNNSIVLSVVLFFNSSIKIKILFYNFPSYNIFSSTFPSLIHTSFDSQHTQMCCMMGPCFCLFFTLPTGTELHVVNFVFLTIQPSLALTPPPFFFLNCLLMSYSHILCLNTHFPDDGNHLYSVLLQNN